MLGDGSAQCLIHLFDVDEAKLHRDSLCVLWTRVVQHVAPRHLVEHLGLQRLAWLVLPWVRAGRRGGKPLLTHELSTWRAELSRTAVACRTKRSLNAFGPNRVLNVNVNGLPVRWCTPPATQVDTPGGNTSARRRSPLDIHCLYDFPTLISMREPKNSSVCVGAMGLPQGSHGATAFAGVDVE